MLQSETPEIHPRDLGAFGRPYRITASWDKAAVNAATDDIAMIASVESEITFPIHPLRVEDYRMKPRREPLRHIATAGEWASPRAPPAGT
jgi:hypothetical protein